MSMNKYDYIFPDNTSSEHTRILSRYTLLLNFVNLLETTDILDTQYYINNLQDSSIYLYDIWYAAIRCSIIGDQQ